MKNIVLMLVLIVNNSYVCSMEVAQSSIILGTTKINANQGYCYQAERKVDFIVIEKNYQQFLKSKAIEVVEPRGLKYDEGEVQQQAAFSDLSLYYDNVLALGLKQELDKKDTGKSIAFDILAVKMGFPEPLAIAVAIERIYAFIEKHPYAYSCIELFLATTGQLKFCNDLLYDIVSKPVKKSI